MANHPWGMPDILPISAPGATRAIGEAYFPPLDIQISRSLSTSLSEPRYSPCISGPPIVERVPSPMNAVVARKSHSSPPTPIRRDSYSTDSRVTYKDLVGSSRQTGPPLYYDEVADDVNPHELYEEHRLDHLAHKLFRQLTYVGRPSRLAYDLDRTQNQIQIQAPRRTRVDESYQYAPLGPQSDPQHDLVEPIYYRTPVKAPRRGQMHEDQSPDSQAIREMQKEIEGLKSEIRKKSPLRQGKRLGFYDFTKKEETKKSHFPAKAPKFVAYDGTTDTQHHLVSFCSKCRMIAGDDALLINYFQESLAGDALTWYTSVPSNEINTFEDVI
ncbi:hypothetical protein MRB53_016262 [Persea americana]|uniref:Uncharacterized protein n=1 Tax=Persea americana TaxID=3435 RepID=A0ACC2M280_PERAE|nr:hypothetical protein MRB53_016262 [Persea americana]